MKTKRKCKPTRSRFQLKLLGYGTFYYAERIAKLQATLRRKPRTVQIDMMGPC